VSYLHRLFGVAVVAATIGGAALTLGVGTASAYGNAHGAQQVYQIAISGNCNNPDLCGNELGGFWGWGVLYADGTGEAEITGCGHMADAHGPGLEGAGHEHIDFHWIIDNGMIVAVSETDVAVGHGQPTTIEIPNEYEVIAPAAPGHYSTQDIMGFSGPGVSFQIQVVQLH
jgi:hypothetical protein